MTIQFFFDLLLVLSTIGLAFSALFSAEHNRSVILFMAFGLLMSLIWIRLNALDIALVEITIGSGLTGALLLSTIHVLHSDTSSKEKTEK